MHIPRRWIMLAVLFGARTTMAFQYESIAAVAPLMRRDLDLSLADVGLLFGLYLAPGILLAVPGGALGNRFGDKRSALAGFLLMLAGGVLALLYPDWAGQLFARLLAGIGGVILNVLMSKMIADWFVGYEIATAMGIFVNSWPAGIALALTVLPPLGIAQGLPVVFALSLGVVTLGALMLAALYTSPPATGLPATASASPDRLTLASVGVAGLIWGLYNAALVMVFAFGPSLLVERGQTIAMAGFVIGFTLWLAVVSLPAGGIVADRLGRHGAVAVVFCIATAGLMLVAPRTEDFWPVFIALGLVSGLPAGPIMSLPPRVLRPETRALGMGLFFTVFYVCMLLGPSIAGRLAAFAGSAQATFDFGAAMIAACVPLFFAFQHLARRVSARAASPSGPAPDSVTQGTRTS